MLSKDWAGKIAAAVIPVPSNTRQGYVRRNNETGKVESYRTRKAYDPEEYKRKIRDKNARDEKHTIIDLEKAKRPSAKANSDSASTRSRDSSSVAPSSSEDFHRSHRSSRKRKHASSSSAKKHRLNEELRPPPNDDANDEASND